MTNYRSSGRLAIKACFFVVWMVLFARCVDSGLRTPSSEIKRLDSMIQVNEIFKARRFFELRKSNFSEYNQLRFEAILGNYFNAPEKSNEAINKLYEQYDQRLNDSIRYRLLRIKLQNFAKLFQYRDAAEVSNLLLVEHANFLDSAGVSDIKNQFNIWNGLSNYPPQSMVKSARSEIKLVDGFKLPVSFLNSDSTTALLFDTGAGFSVITETLARRMEMKFLDVSLVVKNILGDNIYSKLAISSALQLGNVRFSNVVFMVFPDESLFFPAANFQMNGILGFPVINALEEMQISTNGIFTVPIETSDNAYSNLALDFVTPVIEVVTSEDSLPFTFDSGANRTWLHKKYYTKYRENIESRYDTTSLHLAGINGDAFYPGYKVDFQLNFDSTTIDLKSVPLMIESANEASKYYYGNLGQDAIKSFDEMTVSFKHMFVMMSTN